MNRTTNDHFEKLLYMILVTIDERTSVAEVAKIIEVDVESVKVRTTIRVSIFTVPLLTSICASIFTIREQLGCPEFVLSTQFCKEETSSKTSKLA